MKVHARRRRGVAVIVVLVLFTVISAAVTTLGLVFMAQAQRTRTALAGGQLRQLLLAAAPCAQQELSAHGSAPRDVNVPLPANGASLVLHITPSDAQDAPKVQVRAVARLRDFNAAQTFTLTRTPSGAWQIADAQLIQHP